MAQPNPPPINVTTPIQNCGTHFILLARIIDELVNKSNGGRVPYRDSTIGRILKTSLDGDATVVMITTVSGSAEHSAETSSSLHFANQAKHVRTAPKVNKQSLEEMREEHEAALVDIAKFEEEVHKAKAVAASGHRYQNSLS